MKNAVITILAVLVLCLGGYLVYDKVVDKKENKETKNIVENDNTGIIEQAQTPETQTENINAVYYGYGSGKIDDVLSYETNRCITLFSNGKYFLFDFGSDYNTMGEYKIEDDKIKLYSGRIDSDIFMELNKDSDTLVNLNNREINFKKIY